MADGKGLGRLRQTDDGRVDLVERAVACCRVGIQDDDKKG